MYTPAVHIELKCTIAVHIKGGPGVKYLPQNFESKIRLIKLLSQMMIYRIAEKILSSEFQ